MQAIADALGESRTLQPALQEAAAAVAESPESHRTPTLELRAYADDSSWRDLCSLAAELEQQQTPSPASKPRRSRKARARAAAAAAGDAAEGSFVGNFVSIRKAAGQYRNTLGQYKVYIDADSMTAVLRWDNTAIVRIRSYGDIIINTGGCRSEGMFRALQHALKPFELEPTILPSDGKEVVPSPSKTAISTSTWVLEDKQTKTVHAFQDNMIIRGDASVWEHRCRAARLLKAFGAQVPPWLQPRIRSGETSDTGDPTSATGASVMEASRAGEQWHVVMCHIRRPHSV